jgi:hypothetical protein
MLQLQAFVEFLRVTDNKTVQLVRVQGVCVL